MARHDHAPGEAVMIGLRMGLTFGGRRPPLGTIEFIAAGGANGATVSPTGGAAGDLLVGAVLKTTTTAPTHDEAGGALIGSWSSGASSAIAFWQWTESDTPPFGTHENGSRSQFWLLRFSHPPANPIGASDRVSGAASLVMGWAGLTLQKIGSHVLTFGYRGANEAITARSDAVAVAGTAGASARYAPFRSNGPVSAWAAQDVAQAVSGVHQSIAIEVGY